MLTKGFIANSLCLTLVTVTFFSFSGCGNPKTSSDKVSAVASKEIVKTDYVLSEGVSESFSEQNNYTNAPFVINGNYVYFIEEDKIEKDEYSLCIYRSDLNTQKTEALAGTDENLFFISNNNLFYNAVSGIMRMDLLTNKTVCAVKGSDICFFDYEKQIIYYYRKNLVSDGLDESLYCATSAVINWGNEKLVSAADVIGAPVTKIDGLIYCSRSYTDENGKLTGVINLLNSENGSVKELVKIQAEPEGANLTVNNIKSVDGWLYFVAGIGGQGSGHYFFGSLYRVKPNGTDLSLLADVGSTDYSIQDGYIYYGNIESKYSKSKGYTDACRLDGTDKKPLTGKVGIIVYSDENYIYRCGFDEKIQNYFYRTDKSNSGELRLIALSQENANIDKQIFNELQEICYINGLFIYSVKNIDEKLLKNEETPLKTSYYTIKPDGTDNKLFYERNLPK